MLYPWFKFFQNLIFWQAVWFLYFQSQLSAAEAILLYAVYDVATTLLEVPSGYLSDRLGRRVTLLASVVAGFLGAIFLGLGQGFAIFVAGQVLMGAAAAFASGTDSALLYEALVAEDRADDIARQELRTWRFSFAALALSAVTGGAMAVWSGAGPFLASAAALLCALIIALKFTEPPHGPRVPQGGEWARLGSLGVALRTPVLTWLLVLSLLMYGFSHLPFIFGQPFISEALAAKGWQSEAPLVSGIVSTSMMLLSLLTSLFALRLKDRIGLPAILLLAFGMQIALVGVLALSNASWVIALLFLRMVPDSLSKPFIAARIQPMLSDDSRATYLSVQSLAGRLVFAASLAVASLSASQVGDLPYSDIQRILTWYVVIGVASLVALALVARKVRVAEDISPAPKSVSRKR